MKTRALTALSFLTVAAWSLSADYPNCDDWQTGLVCPCNTTAHMLNTTTGEYCRCDLIMIGGFE